VKQGYPPQWHWVWNNGCAAQLKSSKPWYFVSEYPNLIWGCKMLWNFFWDNHGKGPHDGARVVVKRFFWRKQLNAQGRMLQNVEEVVAFLCKCLFECPKSSYSCSMKLST
jgi:hypothetical protein